MKTRTALKIVLMGWLLGAVPAMAVEHLGEVLQKTMLTNQAEKVLTCFASPMEVSVLGKSVVCTAEQAVEILDQFLAENQIKTCSILHSGKKSNAGFYIITATTSHKRYRIYALERSDGNSNLIRQFRIDEVPE